MVYQMNEPSSVDDQVSEACVGPTSNTPTTGFVGAAISPGTVTVTALLGLDTLPAASLA